MAAARPSSARPASTIIRMLPPDRAALERLTWEIPVPGTLRVVVFRPRGFTETLAPFGPTDRPDLSPRLLAVRLTRTPGAILIRRDMRKPMHPASPEASATVTAKLGTGIKFRLASALLLFSLWAGPALADPCKAIPDRGPLPPGLGRGQSFTGRVVYVGDGDSLCVARSAAPDDWIEVRLADFYAPELDTPAGQAAKATLSALTLGRTVTCRAQHRSWDRIVATCARDRKPLGALLRQAGVREGGRGRR